MKDHKLIIFNTASSRHCRHFVGWVTGENSLCWAVAWAVEAEKVHVTFQTSNWRGFSTIRSFLSNFSVPTALAVVILYRGLVTDALWPLFQILVRKLPDGRELWGRIVETEAYLGGEDEASHSRGGKQTQRNAAMFMKPGTLYVYQIYGIYFCMNVSSQGKLRLKEMECQQDEADISSCSGAAHSSLWALWCQWLSVSSLGTWALPLWPRCSCGQAAQQAGPISSFPVCPSLSQLEAVQAHKDWEMRENLDRMELSVLMPQSCEAVNLVPQKWWFREELWDINDSLNLGVCCHGRKLLCLLPLSSEAEWNFGENKKSEMS